MTVPRTQVEMFACLRADEARYRSAFWTANLQMNLGGNIERQGKSSYPLNEKMSREERSQPQQQKLMSHAPQAVYLKAHVANAPSLAQSFVIEQPYHPSQPSWQMDIN